MKVAELDKLFPEQMDALLVKFPVVVMPIGTIEWHSHHLPIGVDTIKAEAIARLVANETGAVLAPTTWFAAGGVSFPHTMHLPSQIIEDLFTEVWSQMASMGFRVIFALQGHFGLDHSLASRRAAVRAMATSASTVMTFADFELLTDLGNRGDHAGAWETSLLWAVAPDLVRPEFLRPGVDLPGVIGSDPREHAARSMGRRGVGAAVRAAARIIERALGQDERQRKEYVEALEMAVQCLEAIGEQRRRLPRDRVPPIATPLWLEHLDALRAGKYEVARSLASQRLLDLSR